MFKQIFKGKLGKSSFLFYFFKRRRYVDVVILITTIAFVLGFIQLGKQWISNYKPLGDINLSPWMLPKYTFFSAMRGIIAYFISLAFTIVYAFWAAKDIRAEKILIPLLDILQSIPVLVFMPGLVIAITSAKIFHNTNFGLELAAIIMIFTGQVWNMILSLYNSFKSIPPELKEVGIVYRFSWWERLRWIELPFGATGLAWNSMMSMAGGWFFLVITETFSLGDKNFRLPGLGSYMVIAVEKQNILAMVYAILAMIIMIMLIDQIVWRPVMVWVQRFRIADTTTNINIPNSWLLKLLRYSRIVRWMGLKRSQHRLRNNSKVIKKNNITINFAYLNTFYKYIANVTFIALLALVVIIMLKLLGYIINSQDKIIWIDLVKAGYRTLVRVLISTIIGTIWTIPAGLAIGLSKRLSKIFQPIVQIAASFPAPILFPLIILTLVKFNIGYNYGCVMLMLLGTQWYILFNIIAGAMAIPNELLEAATSFHLSHWQKFKLLYLPASLSYLVTGWVAASGGAWNTSIIAEYYNAGGTTYKLSGLGAIISTAAYEGNYTILIAGTLLMSIIVIVFNKLVWKPCYTLACTKYSLDK